MKSVRKFRSHKKDVTINSGDNNNNNNNNSNSNNNNNKGGNDNVNKTSKHDNNNNNNNTSAAISYSSSSPPPSPTRKPFSFSFSPKRFKSKHKKGAGKSLRDQEQVLSPAHGSLFDLADHKVKGVYGLGCTRNSSAINTLCTKSSVIDTTRKDGQDDRLDNGSPSKRNHHDKRNINGRPDIDTDTDPIAAFQPLANAKLKQFSPPTSPTHPESTSTSTSTALTVISPGSTSNRKSSFKPISASSDEVHAMNKKKRDDYIYKKRRSSPIITASTIGGDTSTTPGTSASTTSMVPSPHFPPHSNNSSMLSMSSMSNNGYISTPSSLAIVPMSSELKSISNSSSSSLHHPQSGGGNGTSNISRYSTSTPPLLLPPRIDSKGSSSCYSFSAASSLDLDTSLARYSLTYPWSPLNQDADDNDNRNGISNGNGSGNDDDDDLSYGSERDGIEIRRSPFPNDPFSNLNNEHGTTSGTTTSTATSVPSIKDSKEKGGEEDENKKSGGGGDDDNNNNNMQSKKDDDGSSYRGSPIIKTELTQLFTRELGLVETETETNQHAPSSIYKPNLTSFSQQQQQQQQQQQNSHPGSIQINEKDNVSVTCSSIGESIEPLSNIHILSMSEFLQLDEPQRIQAYRTLADTAAETVTEIDEKRTEIFSMGRQVDELSRRVGDLIDMRVESKKKMKFQKSEIVRLKEIVNDNGDGDEKVSSLAAELEAKNAIIEALKESIDQHTSKSVEGVKKDVKDNEEEKSHGMNMNVEQQREDLELNQQPSKRESNTQEEESSENMKEEMVENAQINGLDSSPKSMQIEKDKKDGSPIKEEEVSEGIKENTVQNVQHESSQKEGISGSVKEDAVQIMQLESSPKGETSESNKEETVGDIQVESSPKEETSESNKAETVGDTQVESSQKEGEEVSEKIEEEMVEDDQTNMLESSKASISTDNDGKDASPNTEEEVSGSKNVEMDATPMIEEEVSGSIKKDVVEDAQTNELKPLQLSIANNEVVNNISPKIKEEVNRQGKEDNLTTMKRPQPKSPHEKSVKERVRAFERVGFVDNLRETRGDTLENELSGRVKDLIIELEAKDDIIDELKVSLEKHYSYESYDVEGKKAEPCENIKQHNDIQDGEGLNKKTDEGGKSQEGSFKESNLYHSNENKSVEVELLQKEIEQKNEALEDITSKLKLLEEKFESVNQIDPESERPMSNVKGTSQEEQHSENDEHTKEKSLNADNHSLEKLGSDIQEKDRNMKKNSNEVNSMEENELSNQVKTLLSTLEEKDRIIEQLKASSNNLDSKDKSEPDGNTNNEGNDSAKDSKRTDQSTNDSSISEEEDTSVNDIQTRAESPNTDNQSMEALRKEIQEKDGALEKVTTKLNSLQKEDVKRSEFYRNELRSSQENMNRKKGMEMERINIEKEILAEKLKNYETNCIEKDKLSERVKELEDENTKKNKLLERMKDLEEQIIEKEKLVEKVEELENEQFEKEKMSKRIKEMETELGDVSGLLEETFRSVKQMKESTSAGSLSLPEQQNGAGGRAAALFRLSPKRSSNHDLSKKERTQLENICQVHQQTVLRQRTEVDKLQQILNEKDTQLNELRIQATTNEVKISALETQFIELNKAQEEEKKLNAIPNMDNYKDKTATSIIKIDKAFIAALEAKATRDSDSLEELKNQISVLQSRNEKLKEKIGLEDKLRHDIQDLTTKLQARDLIIAGLEKSYNEARVIHDEKNNSSNDDEEAGANNESSTPIGKESILSLRKIAMLQEIQNASVRRLHSLVEKLGAKETEDSLSPSPSSDEVEDSQEENTINANVSIIVSLSDKLTLLHDYLKVSLYLLECKLSNELESSTSAGSGSATTNHETDEAINARFDLTLESLKEIENEMKRNLDIFGKEVKHQNIKISAKDGVIENLLKTDERLNEKVDRLQSEVDVFKSLSTYSSVNVGVMTRFQECYKLEQELEEKEVEVKRLTSIIEEGVVNEDDSAS